jgi:outer membrane protein, multidrug efflux system
LPFIPHTLNDTAHMLEVIHARSSPPCSARYRWHVGKQLRGSSGSGLCAGQQTIDTKSKTAHPLYSKSNSGHLIPIGDGAALLKRRPDVREAEWRLAAATARIGVATADLYPRISLTGFFGGVSPQFDQLTANSARAWGIGPSISWSSPNQSLPRARVAQAKAKSTAAPAGFDAVVLQALKETEPSLATYGAELDRRQALADALSSAQKAFALAHEQFIAGSLTSLELLITEQSLVAADAAVAASDAALVQDQVAAFKALGGRRREP